MFGPVSGSIVRWLKVRMVALMCDGRMVFFSVTVAHWMPTVLAVIDAKTQSNLWKKEFIDG